MTGHLIDDGVHIAREHPVLLVLGGRRHQRHHFDLGGLKAGTQAPRLLVFASHSDAGAVLPVHALRGCVLPRHGIDGGVEFPVVLCKRYARKREGEDPACEPLD